ncbi:MAG: DNA internalization-related competence protein ComEC/Rec2 [Bacillota bacterium]|nr:DNA internalization-related competence protein ComEC/Rec2 [Bacillota bacterium]
MAPLVLITVAYGAGIALAYTGIGVSPAVALAGALVFLVATVWGSWRGKRETPFFLLFCFVFAGYAWAGLSRVAFPPELEPFLGHYVKLRGTIAERPVIYPNRIVFTLQEPTVELAGESRRGPGKIQAAFYFPAGPDGRDESKGAPLQEVSGRQQGENGLREDEGSRLEKLLPGDRVLFQGRLDLPPEAANPGDFNYREYLARRGIVARLEAQGLPVFLGSGEGDLQYLLRRSLSLVRQRVEKGIEEDLHPAQASFLMGVLLGAKEELTPDDREVYQRTGVMHLFAVSGLHLGFVLFFFLALARLLRFGRSSTLFLVAFGVLGYAALVGFPPSVTRAAVMGLTGTVAYLWPRRKSAPASLAFAALVILIFHPGSLFDAGFQLSFAATWGIIYLAGPLGDRLPLPPGWKGAVTVPLGAQLAVLPLLALYFQQIPFLSLVANILVVLLAGLVVNLGLAGMILTLLHQGLAGPFFLTAGALTLPIRGLLDIFAAVPGGTLAAPSPPWFLTAAWFTLLAIFNWSFRSGNEVSFPHFRFRPPARRWLIPSLVGLLLTGFLLVRGIDLSGTPGQLRVTFLNVGQGDAVLVETPGRRSLLVDGGGKPAFSQSSFDPGRQVVVPYLTRRGIRRLDLVVNSHPHEDHLGGLLAVCEKIQVGEVVAPPVKHPTPLWLKFEALLEERGIPLHRVSSGTTLHLDPKVRITFLHPPPSLLTGTRSDLNNNSLVMRLEYGRFGFLLTGDIEQEGMTALVEAVRRGSLSRELLQAVVLKAPHHGSATGIVLEFAALVRPQVVVISVGPNSFGHPSPETLRFWQEQKATVLRTDTDGAVIFETDGKRLILRTGRARDVSHRS